MTDTLADARTGKNGRHRLAGLLRQSVFGRLAEYEDVNDADRLRRDPVMRWVVSDRAISGSAASASQMGRFETNERLQLDPFSEEPSRLERAVGMDKAARDHRTSRDNQLARRRDAASYGRPLIAFGGSGLD